MWLHEVLGGDLEILHLESSHAEGWTLDSEARQWT